MQTPQNYLSNEAVANNREQGWIMAGSGKKSAARLSASARPEPLFQRPGTIFATALETARNCTSVRPGPILQASGCLVTALGICALCRVG